MTLVDLSSVVVPEVWEEGRVRSWDQLMSYRKCRRCGFKMTEIEMADAAAGAAWLDVPIRCPECGLGLCEVYPPPGAYAPWEKFESQTPARPFVDPKVTEQIDALRSLRRDLIAELGADGRAELREALVAADRTPCRSLAVVRLVRPPWWRRLWAWVMNGRRSQT